MIITYLGKQFFKITQGDLTIAINPIGKNSKIKKVSSFGSDLVFVTTNHSDYNGVENVTYGDKNPFVISGPGEYEAKGLFIKGILNNTEIGGNKYINTIYSFSLDDISICFLGSVNSKNISTEAREAIGNPDIVFIPCGGVDLLSPIDAYNLAFSFDPKCIIPMDFGDDMEKGSIDTFIKEAGGGIKTEPKLTLKKKDLEQMSATVKVLEY